MTKPKPRPKRAVDAVSASLSREAAKRQDGLKPIEIVKVAICAYQDHVHAETSEKGAPESGAAFESADRTGLRRGTQAAIDRLPIVFDECFDLAYGEEVVAIPKRGGR